MKKVLRCYFILLGFLFITSTSKAQFIDLEAFMYLPQEDREELNRLAQNDLKATEKFIHAATRGVVSGVKSVITDPLSVGANVAITAGITLLAPEAR